MIGVIVAGVIRIVTLPSRKIVCNYQCDSLYISRLDGDSISLDKLIKEREKLLIMFVHPTCVYCPGELDELNELNMPELTANIVSVSSESDLEKFIGNRTFAGLGEVNFIADTTVCWTNTLNVKLLPTTFYFRNGNLEAHKTGAVPLGKLME
mgnify:FL=1